MNLKFVQNTSSNVTRMGALRFQPASTWCWYSAEVEARIGVQSTTVHYMFRFVLLDMIWFMYRYDNIYCKLMCGISCLLVC